MSDTPPRGSDDSPSPWAPPGEGYVPPVPAEAVTPLEGSRLKGDLAPSAPSTGSLAHSLTKVEERPQGLQPGQKTRIEGGNSTTVELPKRGHISSKIPEVKIDIQGIPIEVSSESYDYIRTETAKGAEEWAVMANPERSTIVLRVLGYEVAIDTTPYLDLPIRPEINKETLSALNQLKEFLDPNLAAQLDILRDSALQQAEVAGKKHDTEKKLQEEQESAPIYLEIGRGDVTGHEQGIVIRPRTTRKRPTIMLLQPNHEGANKDYGSQISTDISSTGIGIPLPPEYKHLRSGMSRQHLFITIEGTRVTIKDGGESTASTNGSDIDFS